MREVVLGTAGHVDHGKTSLVKALTGINTDRLKEERERGITIELGFAFLDLPCGHRIGIVDVPGHEKFVKNMVAGAAGIDLVLFVVAADEGIMPQSREHFEICSLLGVKRGIIVITKTDLVDEEWLELVVDDVHTFFEGSFLENAPLLTVSSSTMEGIEALRTEIDKVVADWVFEEAFGPFRLPVDRIFSMKGFGAVVTGTSISGRIGIGEDVMVYPPELKAKIRGIQVHGKEVESVEAGHRTAINIQGIDKEQIERGQIIAQPNTLVSTFMLDCEFLYLSSNSKKLKNRTRVRVHIGTAEIMGRVVLLDCEEAEPGLQTDVQLLLEEPLTAWPGDHFVVRSYSPVATIGGGVILNACPTKKRRRFKSINKEIFAIYKENNIEDLMVFHLQESGFVGLTAEQLAARLGIFGNRLKKALNAPVSAKRILIVDSERQKMIAGSVYEQLEAELLAIVDKFHLDNPIKNGLGKEELRSRLHKGLESKIFSQLINRLEKQKKIVQEGAVIRASTHEVALAANEQELIEGLEKVYLEGGLKPKTRKEIAELFASYPKNMLNEVLEILIRDEKIRKLTEDLYFHTTHLDTLKDKLLTHLKKEGEIDAQGFKAMTGISRKYSIPLLEYFDKERLTIRVGDKRVLREKRSN